MAIFAFYPSAPHLRRSDGIGFVLAEGSDVAAARASAQSLIGGSSIEEFTAVAITAGAAPVAVQGAPVGARAQSTWPTMTRGGDYLTD